MEGSMSLRQSITDGGFKVLNAVHRSTLRLSGGRIGRSGYGMSVVELHTVGRKTGQARVSVLTSPLHDEQRVLLVASKFGDDRNPQWYGNLTANPDVEIVIDGQRRQLRARTASAVERLELVASDPRGVQGIWRIPEEDRSRNTSCDLRAPVGIAPGPCPGGAGSSPRSGSTMPPMTMEPAGAGGDDAFDLSMAISSLQSNSTDSRIMLKLLVAQLSDVLGNRIVVERAGGRFRKSEEIKSVQVTLGDDTLRADVDGPTVRCSIGHSSGGIRIRSEQVGMDAWLTRLLTILHSEAAHSEQTRLALENIVIGESS